MATQRKPYKARARRARHAQIGDVIKGRYQILALIGKGGMSRVYLAMDQQLSNKQWAVKEVDRNAKDPMGRPIEQSLASEAGLLSRLNHPSIVDIVDIEVTDDFIYVIEDHVEGQTLAAVVRQEGPQSEEDVKTWMVQVCDALGYLHRQDPPIIYRDMKPSNIMLRPDGYIKLIDLGVAREYKDEARKDTVAFGTTGYAAPEQYGKAQTDARTDIYTLGATMWHLLAGEAPPVEFPLPDVRTKNPNVGEGFAEVIIPKCCALERSERYQSCEELVADLEVYEELTREYRTKQKRKVWSFAACLVASVLCLIIGLGCLYLRDVTITENFEAYVAEGANQLAAGNTDAAKTAYQSAIDCKPAEADGYLGLIDAYEYDGTFTTDESDEFLKVYNANLTSIRSSDDVSEIYYEIGQLYFYYYAYGSENGDNQSTRYKASLDYFEVAASDEDFENHEMAQVYYTIASFADYVSSSSQVKTYESEESDEMYAEYWASLEELEERMSTQSGEYLRLDCYTLIVDAMISYMDKFEGAGVTEEQVEELYGNVKTQLESMTCSNEEYEEMRSEALSKLTTEALSRYTAVYAGASVS